MVMQPLRTAALILLLALPGWAWAQPDAWLFQPNFQFNMTLTGVALFDGTQDTLLNNAVAVISRGQLRGMATPQRVAGKTLYFLSMFSTKSTGDTLQFLAYRGSDGKVYRSARIVVFAHQAALGTALVPDTLRFTLDGNPVLFNTTEVPYLENTCAKVLDVAASDRENREGNGLTFSLAGGEDEGRFKINANTGMLRWDNFAPDADNPADANGDNVYLVRVRVKDANNNTDEQEIRVRVIKNLGIAAIKCPGNQVLRTNDDGTGNCTSVAPRTGVPLPTLCAYDDLTYTLTGALVDNGDGLVPFQTPFPPGVTTVQYTFQQGSTYTCSFSVTITDQERPSLTCPTNKTVPAQQAQPCAATVTDLNAAASDNCPDFSLQYAISGATTATGTGQLGSRLFLTGLSTVAYTITDNAGLSASCSFTVSVGACLSFEGKINFANGQTSLGVKDAILTLTGSAGATDTTDAGGLYFIEVPQPTGTFTLRPAKSINKLNGVTSADALAIQRHLSGIGPITNMYRLAAADVNQSNSVTTADAGIISQAILNNPTALAQFLNSWRFVPKSHTMTNPPWNYPEQIVFTNISQDQVNQDFWGIKMGDVASPFANPANFGGSAEYLRWTVDDAILQAGETRAVAFYASPVSDLSAWQFALRFDTAALRFERLETAPGFPALDAGAFGTFNLDEGVVRSAWSSAQPMVVKQASVVFTLYLQALHDGVRLSEVLALDPLALEPLSYTSAFAETPIALQYRGVTSAHDLARPAPRLLSNRPNPFEGRTTLRFDIPEACDATLRVYDATGRLVAAQQAFFQAGTHEWVFEEKVGHSHVYIAELVTPWGVSALKMLCVR